MPVFKDLSGMNSTQKKSAYKLRGTIPTGFRILSKKQVSAYNKAKQKLRKEQKTKEKVKVQLHRNEKVLDFAENTAYEAIMKKAKKPYKK